MTSAYELACAAPHQSRREDRKETQPGSRPTATRRTPPPHLPYPTRQSNTTRSRKRAALGAVQESALFENVAEKPLFFAKSEGVPPVHSTRGKCVQSFAFIIYNGPKLPKAQELFIERTGRLLAPAAWPAARSHVITGGAHPKSRPPCGAAAFSGARRRWYCCCLHGTCGRRAARTTRWPGCGPKRCRARLLRRLLRRRALGPTRVVAPRPAR